MCCCCCWLAGWLKSALSTRDSVFVQACAELGTLRAKHCKATLAIAPSDTIGSHMWQMNDVGPIAAFRSCHRFPQGVLHPGGLGILSNLLMAMYFYTSIEAGNRHHVSRGGGCRSFQVLEVFFLWVSCLQGRVCTCGACASLPRCLVVCCRSRRLCSCRRRRRPRRSRRSELPS